MIGTGSVNPADFAANLTSDQDLEDINAWLDRLSQNYVQNPMMLDNVYSVPYVTPSDPYAGLLSNPAENAAEVDLYVRSHPVPPFTGYDQQMQHYHDNMTVGQRDHYTAIPDISLYSIYQHELQTSMNLRSANKRDSKSRYMLSTDGQSDKTDVGEQLRIVKSAATDEQKKNLSTLANVFRGNDSDEKGAESKPPTPHHVCATLKQEHSGKKEPPDTKETQSEEVVRRRVSDTGEVRSGGDEKKKGGVNQDVMDMLSKDLSDLSMKNKEQLYPSLTQCSRTRQKELIQMLRQQINDAYRQKKHGMSLNTATTSANSPDAGIVKVQ
ncbi:hypothetical protein BX666DRAFT_1024459 [Dichotomocladium elegans]|nr:hypothetical protein BX666DRAFT_1024459 [Dichotomocladium elegans]